MLLETENRSLEATESSPVKPTKIERLEAEARTAVASYNRTATKALGRTNTALYEALEKVYAVCVMLDAESEARGRFLKRHKIKVHAQTRNPYHPILRAFCGSITPETRTSLYRGAAAIGLAALDNTPVNKFQKFLREKKSLEKAAREYSQRTKPSQTKKNDLAQARRDRIEESLSEHSQVYEPNRHTLGRFGRQIAAVAIDDKGCFAMLRVFDLDPQQVEKLILARTR